MLGQPASSSLAAFLFDLRQSLASEQQLGPRNWEVVFFLSFFLRQCPSNKLLSDSLQSPVGCAGKEHS